MRLNHIALAVVVSGAAVATTANAARDTIQIAVLQPFYLMQVLLLKNLVILSHNLKHPLLVLAVLQVA